MKVCETRVYIAAPFFNQEQLLAVNEIENILDKYGIEYFSPRLDGVLTEMSKTEKSERMKGIFLGNIAELNRCNLMIAVIDNYDTGTVFELGFFFGKKKEEPIITVSNRDFDLNVMLKFSVSCHLKKIESLSVLISSLIESKENEQETFRRWCSAPEAST